MRIGLLITAAALAMRTTALAQDSTPRVPEVAASGRGEISVTPDRAVLSVTVENNASLASTAAADNARMVASTLERLHAAGATAAQLSNGGYSLNQDYENGDRRRPRGFVARNTVRLEVPNATNVGKFIDAAISGGATIVTPIQYLGPNMPTARRDALKAAVAEATRDAQTLAEASGGSLGRLLSMTTGINAPSYPVRGGTVITSQSITPFPQTSIQPDDLIVSAIATGRWEFIARR